MSRSKQELRIEIAAFAMQGLLAGESPENGEFLNTYRTHDGRTVAHAEEWDHSCQPSVKRTNTLIATRHQGLAAEAVKCADALLAELFKVNERTGPSC
jgi:hypothetical protein